MPLPNQYGRHWPLALEQQKMRPDAGLVKSSETWECIREMAELIGLNTKEDTRIHSRLLHVSTLLLALLPVCVSSTCVAH